MSLSRIKKLYPHKGSYFATDRQMDMRTGTLLIAALFPNPGNLLIIPKGGKVIAWGFNPRLTDQHETRPEGMQ